MKKGATGRSCYTSKYALSERLVCGECGTLYRRCSWKGKEKPRTVWRCVSRLDYGKKYCHDSPTMDEEPLQQAILDAINSAASSKESLTARVTDALMDEMAVLPGSGKTLGEIQQRLDALDREFDSLLSRTENAEENAARFKALSDEMTSLKVQREKIAAQLRKNGAEGERVQNAVTAVKQINHQMTEWDETLIRQLVHTVKVISASHIQVCLMDGTVIEQEVRKQ